jgi:hypothetical protein
MTTIALAIAMTAGCGSRDASRGAPPLAGPEIGQQAISDQVHSSGHAGFFWLPPLVAAPTLQGAFDATQEPAVTITPLVAGATPIATYTTTTGPGSETIRVDAASQNYIVNWHTDQFTLDPSVNYRIAVTIHGQTAGFLDVDVVTSQAQAKNVDTSQYIGLVDGKTLPIKWFLNACGSVFCAALDQCHDVGTCDYTTGACSNPSKANGAACDDGDACTQSDTCFAGTCTGANPVVCMAEDQCHVAGTCNPASGACSNPNAADGTACSTPGFTSADGSCEAGVCVAYTVGGTLRGIANGASVVLLNQGGDARTVGANGSFTFPTPMPDGAGYAVTVAGPASDGQSCSVTNGSGTIAGANVTSVAVACAPLLTTLASGQAGPDGVAVNGGGVYWVNFNGGGVGSVMSVATTGGAATALATGQSGPRRVAVDETNAYWTNSDGTIGKIARAGGTPVVIARGSSAYGIAIDASNAYWTDLNAGTVNRTPLGGGATVAIAFGSQPLDVAVDATNAYWTDAARHTVSKVPIGGGTTVTLFNGLSIGGDFDDGIAVDAKNVYWVNSGVNQVDKESTSGGTVTVLASSQAGPASIAVDETSVYWPDQTGGTIMKVPLAGGPVTTLATGQVGPLRIAVDAASVYWTDGGGGTVMKLTPK